MPTTDFKDVLNNIQEIKVSKHAEQRLKERNIQIDQKQWQVIGEKMSEAKKKGVTDSLVVTNDGALIVSTKNKTVGTAMGREDATTKLFTNIKGKLIINE